MSCNISSPHRPRSQAAFTLVELLTVIAIIGILASIVIPSVAGMINNAKQTKSISNLREIGKTALIYATRNGGAALPAKAEVDASNAGDEAWYEILSYVNTTRSDRYLALFTDPLYQDANNLGIALNIVPMLPTSAVINDPIDGRVWKLASISEQPSRMLATQWDVDSTGTDVLENMDAMTDVDAFNSFANMRNGKLHINVVYFDSHVGQVSDVDAFKNALLNP